MSPEFREAVIRGLTKFAYYAHGGKRRHVADTLRTPATINPDDRDKWRGFAASSAHLGRTVETFVTHAVADGRHGKHAEYTLTRQNTEREIEALCAEIPGAFPSSQAGLAAVRGAL